MDAPTGQEALTDQSVADAPPPLVGWDDDEDRPPWSEGAMPDPRAYVESELAVAGALSTMPPFASFHPGWALPFARQALHALGEWEPSDSFGYPGDEYPQ